ncbi:hypothetical protein INT47_000102 [Mucor saturninus]|uniref:Uncharacterized protein n=1 Tax=Mucor saturninus TaxID=64648 RepID=A0A8H7RIC1_9FUNG|nr:hypothetical protein INT47_000102 [Mucor saturninus]
MPLASFFSQYTSGYWRPTLYIDKRIETLMDELFRTAEKDKLSKEGLSIKILGLFRHSEGVPTDKRYQNLFDTQQVFKLFLNKDQEFCDIGYKTYLHQEDYKNLFLAIYMGVLETLVMDQLNEEFGIDSKVEKVNYIINVERILCDSIIGSKDKLKNLLVKGNFGDASKNGGIMRISAQEGILPAITQKLKLNIDPGGLFVVAKLRESYIQLTLHQVVEDSFVIKDEIIMIDNVFDALCKKLWFFVANDYGLKYCSTHMYQYPEANFSLEKCRILMAHLKETFKKGNSYLDLNKDVSLKISKHCECSIELNFRDIMDIGIKPILQNIAHIITGAVRNVQIFGHYEAGFILLTGDIFTLSSHTLMHEVYLNLLHSEFESSIKEKKINIRFHVLRESLTQFLQPYEHSKFYEYDCLINGDLQLVSSETYAIYIGGFHNRDSNKEISKPFLSFNNGAKFGGDANTAMLILKTGQPISDKRNVTQLQVKLQNEIEIDLDSHYVLTLVLARLKHTENTVEGEIISSDSISYDDIYEFPVVYDYRNRNFEAPIRFETRYFSHNSTLQFTLGVTEDQRISIPQRPSVAYV